MSPGEILCNISCSYVNEIKIPMLDIDRKLKFDKKTISKFKYNKNKINVSYNRYIKKYIAPDNLNILGHQKFEVAGPSGRFAGIR